LIDDRTNKNTIYELLKLINVQALDINEAEKNTQARQKIHKNPAKPFVSVMD
jgi:hypothetical protein